jgi:hypothetical protein
MYSTIDEKSTRTPTTTTTILASNLLTKQKMQIYVAATREPVGVGYVYIGGVDRPYVYLTDGDGGSGGAG